MYFYKNPTGTKVGGNSPRPGVTEKINGLKYVSQIAGLNNQRIRGGKLIPARFRYIGILKTKVKQIFGIDISNPQRTIFLKKLLEKKT